MKNQKLISMLLCLVLLAAELSGCAPKAGTAAAAGDAAKEPVALTFTVWDANQHPVLQEIAKEFEKIHPDIKVDVQLVPHKQYWTKIEAAASGNMLPDMMWMNGPRFIKYASAGMLLPVDEWVKKDSLDMGKYPKGLVDLYTYEGKLYGMPKDWDVTALWYNKKLFDQAKVSYPTNDWTWQDMMDAAGKITDKNKGVYGIAAKPDTQEGTYNTIPACGGFVISDDKKLSGYHMPENVEGIKVWLDLIDEGLSPTAAEMTETDPLDLFKSEKVAMIYAASWNVKSFMENEVIKDHVDLVVMPKLKTRSAVIHGLANVITSSTKHPEECWTFIQYLAGKEANEMWAKSGVVIPAYEEVLDIWKSAYSNINLQAFIDELEYAYMYPASKNNKWSAYEWDTYVKIWSKQITPEEGCKMIKQEMDKLLAEEQQQ